MCALGGQEKFMMHACLPILVFANSEKGTQGTLFPDWKKEISEVQVVLVPYPLVCVMYRYHW